MSEKDPISEKTAHATLDFSVGDDDIPSAVRWRDWSCLRTLSLRAGGFGDERKYVWPFLMHAEQEASSTKSEDEADSTSSPMSRRRRNRSSSIGMKEEYDGGETGGDSSRSPSAEPHPDERQIKLDTDRSFVLYSVEGQPDREGLQAELNELITSVFRRHPQLSYFQGYHDIITVLFLTLPESEQLLCAEKLSLHRLRDAMGKGLEPLLGLLQILKYLLRLVDPDYAALLERNAPLPYFALSNLLTFFSHDVPTLPLIQHVFDFLLCRPPITIVYLAAAITLARKDEAFKMEQEGEEGMLHSLLSSLPELSDGDKVNKLEQKSGDSNVLREDILNPGSSKNGPTSEPVQAAPPISGVEDACSDASETKEVKLIVEHADSVDAADRGDGVATSSDLLPQASQRNEDPEVSQHLRAGSESSLQTDESHSVTLPGSSIASDLSSSDLRSSEPPETETSSRPASPQSNASSDHAPRQTVSLPALLEHADILFAQYPPSHPALHVSEIMGPQSVIFTWSEDPHHLMSDAEAEAMIAHPELVVLPFTDPDEVAATKEAETSGGGHTRRKLRKRRPRKHFGVRLDKKTVFTGTVVALSVAVAVYSMRAKGNGGVLDIPRSDRTLRKTFRVVSGILIGGSERLLESFGW